MKNKEQKNKINASLHLRDERLKRFWGTIEILLESADEGVLIGDAKAKKFVYANQAISGMLGYTVEELESMRIDDIHREEDMKYVLSEFNSTVNGNKIVAQDIPCLRKDGSIFYANVHGLPALIKGKKYVVALFHDITKQKKMTAELQELRNNLEKLVKERTSELSNEIIKRKGIAETLDEKNIALREILSQLEVEKRVIRDNIINNVTMLILPIINDLRQMNNNVDSKYLDLMEGHLKQLTSSFGGKITDIHLKLTTREMRICDLIKGGLTSKEIGKLLNISPKTVEGFRTSIRKKLGVKNKKINLPTFLQNL